MNPDSHHLSVQSLTRKFDRFEFLFKWLHFFYPLAKGLHFIYLAYAFIPQKIFRINGRVPWPVHFTSRILNYKNITIGNRSAPGLNAHCYIQGRNGIKLGHNVRIGPGVGLISANHDLDDYDKWPVCRPICIGNNVWIGMNTVVLPGVEIGDNVAIGANAVVNQDIPPDSIAVGNPCRVIRKKASYKGTDYSQV